MVAVHRPRVRRKRAVRGGAVEVSGPDRQPVIAQHPRPLVQQPAGTNGPVNPTTMLAPDVADVSQIGILPSAAEVKDVNRANAEAQQLAQFDAFLASFDE